MSAISKHLLPDNAVIDAQGVMSIGGCSLVDVAKEFGTPVFVYDEDHLRARCHEAVKAFDANRVIYATKAFFCTAMAKLAYDEGLMLDVATGGELFVALNAGVPGSSCVMHGNNKSTAELREAMAMGVANGLEPAVLAEIMRQSSGGNWTLEKYNPWPGVMENAPASKGYSGGFMAELMTKDLGLAQEAAQASGSSTPMGALALQLYRLLLKQGKGKQDFSVVQQLFID